MPISFSRIPANWRIPLYWVEVDPSKAGLPINQARVLLVGVQITATAKALVNVPLAIASQAQADNAFGQGSQLANMFKHYFANNWAGSVYGLPVVEGTTAATGTITVATPPTVAGTLHLYIGGTHIGVNVTATDTPTIVAAAIATAVNANKDLMVTATPAIGVVTLTCKGKGIYGNDIRMSDNYFGSIGGEVMPTGLTVTYSAATMASGAGVPVFTTAISNLGENEFEFVAMPYTDSTSLTAWETEYGFSDTGRWGFIRQHYGHVFSAMRDTYANLLTFGTTRNSAQLSVMGVEMTALTSVWGWAAAYVGKASRALLNDPARPLQSLHLEGVTPAPLQSRFLMSELNNLSISGIATQRTLSDNIPMIARETTTSTLNLYGNTDDAYEVVTTLATLARLLRNQRQAITSKFPRHKLADDGTRFGAGQAIVTPKTVKAELVAQYRIDEFNGLVENGKAFKDNLIVERDPNDVNRLNVLYPPDLVNQLRVFAVLAQFRLQYNRGVDLAIV
jgi:phage tail sheath gpL-like